MTMTMDEVKILTDFVIRFNLLSIDMDMCATLSSIWDSPVVEVVYNDGTKRCVNILHSEEILRLRKEARICLIESIQEKMMEEVNGR